MKKKVIIIVIIIAIIAVIGGIWAYFHFKNKAEIPLNNKVIAQDIKDSTSSTYVKEGNYQTTPERSSSSSVDSSDNSGAASNDRLTIDASSKPVPNLPEAPNLDIPGIETATINENNIPEETGILKPITTFKPLEVEQNTDPVEKITLVFDSPTYVLFVDFTQGDSTLMLNYVNELVPSYKDNVQFIIIASTNTTKEQINEYMTNKNINLPIYYDNGSVDSPSVQYGITSFPHALIIDKTGNVVNSISGVKSKDVIAANLDIITENYDE